MAWRFTNVHAIFPRSKILDRLLGRGRRAPQQIQVRPVGVALLVVHIVRVGVERFFYRLGLEGRRRQRGLREGAAVRGSELRAHGADGVLEPQHLG